MKETLKNKILKTKKLKLLALTVFLASGIILTTTTNVQAVLQANYTTHTQSTKLIKSGPEWITQIREMEATNGTMGLSETKSDTTILDNETHNNIDVHMMKTTEWGAVEILAASGYGAGNAEKVTTATTKTTTGNSTGVYFDGATWEWTAGIATKSGTGIGSINSRYYDYYGTTDDEKSLATNTAANGGPKAGDGLGSPTLSGAGCYPGCATWPASSKSRWFGSDTSGLHRGGGSLFSFYGVRADWDTTCACRGVAVVGQDL